MSEKPPIEISKAILSKSDSRLKQDEIDRYGLLQDINNYYAFAAYGAGVTIIQTNEKPVKFITEEAFRSIFYNAYVVSAETGKRERLGHCWLGWPGRREYTDVIFYPGKIKDPTIFNLWTGFSVEPKQGDCNLFLDHIRANICAGNNDLYEWVLDWMADAVQKPHRKNWTAILLRSTEEGTGKGFFATHFGHLFGHHFGAFNKPGQLVGKFNSHLEDKLVVFLDEGSLVEKYAYDFVKSLITEPTLNIEPKGRSIREIKSYHRLIVASNDQEIIRASLTDRRWCVLEVAPNAQNNLAYFDAIEKQMNNGGYEALLWMLQNRKYDEHTVKTAPKTLALRTQKEQNLSKVAQWWRECLTEGRIGDQGWPKTVPCADFFRAYINWCDMLKINNRETSDWLPRRLNEQLKTNFKSKGGGAGRFYEIEPLAEARQSFEQAIGHTIEWENE